MTSWLKRWRATAPDGGDAPRGLSTQPTVRKATTSEKPRPKQSKPDPKDPNAPDRRLQLYQKCLYERRLPGHAFISAHVNRLQHGYYESDQLHEPTLDNIFFVSVHFVFHPQDARSHRFKWAQIKVSIHGDFNPTADDGSDWHASPPPCNPRILKHAPELMYGAVSPENLQWNFSLSSSLGVSHVPLSASLNPSGGVKSSYKLYDMMSIQGSLRTLRSPLGPEYDIEDGMAVWTLQENQLQRSGLPREFDFVLLVHKPDDVKNVYLSVDVDAVVDSWFGDYPQWWTDLKKYQPYQDFLMDFNTDIGQKFTPTQPGRGFNFAVLPHPLEDYVCMPGTTYPTNDTSSNDKNSSGRRRQTFYDDPQDYNSIQQSPQSPSGQQFTPTSPIQSGWRSSAHVYTAASARQYSGQMDGATSRSQRPNRSDQSNQEYPAPTTNRHSWAPENLNIRVLLEHAPPRSPPIRRNSVASPARASPNQQRRRSVRRSQSRSELKEYGVQQALQAIAGDALGNGTPPSSKRVNGVR